MPQLPPWDKEAQGPRTARLKVHSFEGVPMDKVYLREVKAMAKEAFETGEYEDLKAARKAMGFHARKWFWRYKADGSIDDMHMAEDFPDLVENKPAPADSPKAGATSAPEEVEWVHWALGQDTVSREQAPSPGAYGLYLTALGNKPWFYEKLYAKLMPTGREAAEMGKSRSDADHRIQHMDDIKAQIQGFSQDSA